MRYEYQNKTAQVWCCSGCFLMQVQRNGTLTHIHFLQYYCIRCSPVSGDTGVFFGAHIHQNPKVTNMLAQSNQTRSIAAKTHEWLDKNSHLWKPNTARAYTTKASIFFDWLGQNPICSDTIEGFKTHLFRSGKSHKTVSNYLDTLKTFNTNLWKLPANLFPAERLIARSKPYRFFTLAQAKCIIKKMTADNPTVSIFVRLIFYSFLYPCELRGLRIGDINFHTNTIRIDASLARNKQTADVLILNKEFAAELADFAKNRPASAYLFGTDTEPHPANKIRLAHQKLLKAYGYDTKEYQIFSWIHTAARIGDQNGMGAKPLQVFMRRHSLRRTEEYLERMNPKLSDFCEKMPRI